MNVALLVAGIAASAGLAVAPIELKDVKRLPLEVSAVADRADAFAFKTPQNAVKAVTVAVANRSGTSAIYRVAIESADGAERGQGERGPGTNDTELNNTGGFVIFDPIVHWLL